MTWALRDAFVVLPAVFCSVAGCIDAGSQTSPSPSEDERANGVEDTSSPAAQGGIDESGDHQATEPSAAWTDRLYVSGPPNLTLVAPEGSTPDRIPFNQPDYLRAYWWRLDWSYTLENDANLTGLQAKFWIEVQNPVLLNDCFLLEVFSSRQEVRVLGESWCPLAPVLSPGTYEIIITDEIDYPHRGQVAAGDTLSFTLRPSHQMLAAFPPSVLHGTPDYASRISLTGMQEPRP